MLNARLMQVNKYQAMFLLKGVTRIILFWERWSYLMADWHLEEIKNALERVGWRFVAEHPGDEYRISATWEFSRGHTDANLFIDFDGLDDMITLPIEKSYACSVRGTPRLSLYFSKRGGSGSPARERWRDSLNLFVEKIGKLQ